MYFASRTASYLCVLAQDVSRQSRDHRIRIYFVVGVCSSNLTTMTIVVVAVAGIEKIILSLPSPSSSSLLVIYLRTVVVEEKNMKTNRERKTSFVKRKRRIPLGIGPRRGRIFLF